VVVITIFVPILASEKEDIAVTIDVSYSKPSDFSLDPPIYRAGSSITLTCRVKRVVASFSRLEGVEDGLTYSWSSTCTHNCFVRGKTTRSVTRHGLHSMDSGTHTCNVTDALGCTGNATIDMNVMGKNHMLLMTIIYDVSTSFACIFKLSADSLTGI